MSTVEPFLSALRMRESGGDYRVVNTLNFLGAYQFGEAALVDLGFVNLDVDAFDNDFSGGWTGKCDVTSVSGFLNNRAAQDQAADEWLELMWRYIKIDGLDRYAWTKVGDILLTPSGMLAAAHLLGVDALAKFIASGGTADLRDPYQTSIVSYITEFSGYDIPFAAADGRPGDTGGSAPGVVDRSINGNAAANILLGTDADDIVNGLAGDDTLTGGSGDDRLSGGEGGDTLDLDAGTDVLDGGSGLDWVRVRGPQAATVALAATGPQDTGYGSDTILGVENASGGGGGDRLTGTADANVLQGNAGADTLNGLGGDDRLQGGGDDDDLDGGHGNDRLAGGDGNDVLRLGVGDDTMDGGAGSDWVVVTGLESATIDLARTQAQATGYGIDILRDIENASGGSGADKLFGGSGSNILRGNAGHDALYGRLGTDTLAGGLGRDLLFGGADKVRDVFVFAATADSVVGAMRDVVHGFRSGIDDLDLSGMDSRSAVMGDQAFQFSGTTAMAHSVWYVAGRSGVTVRGDVNGDRLADFEIRLDGVSTMTSNDFLL